MDEESNKFDEFEEALETSIKDGKYVLRLFIAGLNPKSKLAIENLQKICDEELEGKCELEIIDIYQQPIYAKEGKIVAAPTLIKELPLPIRRFVGDLSNKEKLLLGLDLNPKSDFSMLDEKSKLEQKDKQILDLQSRLDEAEETLFAIQNGEIDAIITPNGSDGPKVYTLESADSLYRNLVQEMNEGVATLTTDGTIVYGNSQLATMLELPMEKLIGQRL